jgi:hypothetical protein
MLAKFWKRYDVPKFDVTPEGAKTMDVRLMTKADATAYATKEATEIARERQIPFKTAYHTLLDANPPLKEAVAGMGPALNTSEKLIKKYQAAGATEEEARQAAGLSPISARAFINDIAAMNIRQARQAGRTLTYAQAMQAAMDKAPELAERAGLRTPRGTVPNEGSEQMVNFYSGQTVPEAVLKRCYAAGSGADETTHADKLKTTVDLVAKRIAADVMLAGESHPGQRHRDWASAWFAIMSPPPAPISGGGNTAVLSAYNKERQDTIEDILQAARDLLRDPAARATISPTPLGV